MSEHDFPSRWPREARIECDNRDKEIERLRERIEELEKDLKWAWSNQKCENHHIITTDKIRAAWRETLIKEHRTWLVLDVFFGEGMRKALGMLGIVRCEGCRGDGGAAPGIDAHCPDCNGEGWVKE